MPLSTAKNLANNESAIGEFWITKIAEWTKRKERAVVPVSAAKLFSTGFRLIFLFFFVFFFFWGVFFFYYFFFFGTGVGRFPGCLNRTGRRRQNWQLANLWTNASDGNYKISCWINRTICMPFSAVSEELAKIESAITRVQSVSFESQKLLNGQKGRKGLLCLFPQQNCSALDSVWFFSFFFFLRYWGWPLPWLFKPDRSKATKLAACKSLDKCKWWQLQN